MATSTHPVATAPAQAGQSSGGVARRSCSFAFTETSGLSRCDDRPCRGSAWGRRLHSVGRIGALYDQYTRWMYRSGRPNWVARPQNRLSSILFGAGLLPRRAASLEVTGRRSGRTISFPVVVADWEGGEYLVSMLGEQANWVKNVRAAAGTAALRHGRREHVMLEEVDVAGRAPIIRRYAAVAPGGRPHLRLGRHASLEECEALAPNTPVYRITRPAGAQPAPS